MIRRSTVVYIILLVAIVGAYFYLKNRPQATADVTGTPEATEQINYLFTAEEGVPTDIKIQSKAGESVEVARDAGDSWAVMVPIEAKADQGAAEAAASQVETMRILDKVQSVDKKLLGLESPEYTVTVKFKGGAERTVNVGVVTPSESGYYVQNASGGDVVIVSKSSLDALLTMLTTPPYLETLTPSPAVTETFTPAPATPTIAAPNNGTVTPSP
jgi:hypothetical protein